MLRKKYKAVTTLQEILAYLNGAKVVAFDFETAPDDIYRDDDKAALDPAKSHICTMSLSANEGTGIMIPVAHRVGKNMDQADFCRFFHDFLTDPEITKVAHNLAFESMYAYKYDIIIQEPVYDTIAASQMSLKSPTQYRKLSDSGLKKLAKELCGEPLPSFDAVTDGKNFDELDPTDPETIRYSCADSDFALRLMHIFNSWFDRYLPKHRLLVENVESPTAIYIGIMKYNGVPVDIDLMQMKRRQAENKIELIQAEIKTIAGDVNIGSNCSTKAFKAFMFDKLKMPVIKETKNGQPALDDAVLLQLKSWCDSNRSEVSHLVELIQEYRKWNKIYSTYIQGYMNYIDETTMRIHPNFFALNTDTGRFSCNSPNLQNMPRKGNDPIGVRNFVRAPEGQMILSCDFSQIELRVVALYCRDKVMMDTYRTGGDIHAATTSVIFNISYVQACDKHDPDYKERRTIAKNVNFGTIYGLYPKGLQRTLKNKTGIDKSLNECEKILTNLKAGYPALAIWQEITKEEAGKWMYTETWLGRRRYLPDIRSEDWGKKSFAERCALNTPIQGTAADIIKLAMGRLIKGLPERPWLRPILQIHDELTFIVPEERLQEAVIFIKSCMEQKPFPEFDIPLVAEASVGKTFGTLDEVEE